MTRGLIFIWGEGADSLSGFGTLTPIGTTDHLPALVCPQGRFLPVSATGAVERVSDVSRRGADHRTTGVVGYHRHHLRESVRSRLDEISTPKGQVESARPDVDERADIGSRHCGVPGNECAGDVDVDAAGGSDLQRDHDRFRSGLPSGNACTACPFPARPIVDYGVGSKNCVISAAVSMLHALAKQPKPQTRSMVASSE
jgi:hypothetical protein